ncbi:MAG: radical SAM protein [Thermoprotei archaeon]|nr:MAG: radical SAM protein [Thermoprotei archaeon]
MKITLSLSELLYQKQLLLKQLEGKLSRESIERAKADYHSKKLPRPCGITVHVVVGCGYACQYCYLPDMGISFTIPRVYALTGDEMTYSLLLNKAFLPSRKGTFIALGSIGEPFINEEAFSKVLEYLNSFARYLKNPVQFSTKSYLNEEKIRRISKIKIPINPLITIITLKRWKILEPKAPDPWKRLEVIKMLRKHGMTPFLFLRPIMPGINTDETEQILEEAKKTGAYGVVIGGMRITPLILMRLEKLGLDTSEIKKRIKGRLNKGTQTPIYTQDIKQEIVEMAKQKGLIPMLSACCANNFAAYKYDGMRIPCAGLDFIDGKYCTRCPVLCEEIDTKVELEEIERIVRSFLNMKVEVNADRFFIYIRSENAKRAKRRLKKWQKILLETAYRRKLRFE